MKLSLKKAFSFLIVPLVALMLFLLIAVTVPTRNIHSDLNSLNLDISIAMKAEHFMYSLNQQMRQYIRSAVTGRALEEEHVRELKMKTVEAFEDWKKLIESQGQGELRSNERIELREIRTLYEKADQTGDEILKLTRQGQHDLAVEMVKTEFLPLVDTKLLDNYLKPFIYKEEEEIKDTAYHLLKHAESLNILSFNMLKSFINEVITEASLVIKAEKFQRLLNEQITEWYVYIIDPTAEQEDEIKSEQAEIQATLTEWKQLISVEEEREHEEKEELRVVNYVEEKYLFLNETGKRMMDFAKQGKIDLGIDIIGKELDPIVENFLMVNVRHVLLHHSEDFDETLSDISMISQLIKWGIIGFIVLVVTIAIGSPVILKRKIINPILKLKTAASKVGDGDLETSITVSNENEIGELAQSFNTMTESLKQSRDNLEGQVKKRTLELTMTNNKLMREIGERKRAEEQLQYDAFHDSLTGLPNRALFMDRLLHLIVLSRRRSNHPFAILFLDVDRFKIINDSLGHLSGDQLLIMFGKRLLSSLKPGDTVARFGGDEFAILLEDISEVNNILNIAERIQMDLSRPFNLNGYEVFATASIGIASFSKDYENPEEILRDADIAMYQAKAKGKSCSVVFEKGMHTIAVEVLKLETDLRKAVERNEFLVYYQPIVFSSTNSVIGYEALVRWNHPERGLINPVDFIHIAEENGLIVFIDRFVLREACRQMGKWQQQFPGSSLKFISVNLSNKQMMQDDLVEYITSVIQESNIDPACLKLEITENVIIENPEAIIEILSELRMTGVQLYIDDFGTGYSSLSYLHRLPIDGIKIDRSFVRRIGDKGENHEIIKTIMLLAQDMNVDVIAEGIETENQLARIKSLKCEYWQGYLFFKPVDSAHAEALIKPALSANVITGSAMTALNKHPQ